MTDHKRFASILATGMVASVGIADPAGVSFDAGSRTAASSAWLTYIGGVMGPSNVAPSATDSPVRLERSLNSVLFLTLAGPSNTTGGAAVAFNVDTGGLGNGPGTGGANEILPEGPIPPGLVASLQTADRPNVVAHHTEPTTETGPGGFQVVVPLPGAGVLAAGGLALVAIRRRR